MYCPNMSVRSRAMLREEILQRDAIAFKGCRQEYVAARRIQSNFRGFAFRKHLRHLKCMATRIQSAYRGYRDRRIYYQVLEKCLQDRVAGFFDLKSTIIQCTWRGYRSRRTIFDFQRRKIWLNQIAGKTAELEEETWAYFFDERSRAIEEQNAIARKLCVLIARKLHHLLRTRQQPGIYSSASRQASCSERRTPATTERHRTAQTSVERLLASFQFRATNRAVSEEKKSLRTGYLSQRDERYKRTETKVPRLRYARCEEHYRMRDVDAMEAKWSGLDRPIDTSTVATGPKGGSLVRPAPYERQMMCTEKYCDNILAMTREFDILTPRRDFNLNTRIVERPERIEQFVEMLHEFCVTHNLIEK